MHLLNKVWKTCRCVAFYPYKWIKFPEFQHLVCQEGEDDGHVAEDAEGYQGGVGDEQEVVLGRIKPGLGYISVSGCFIKDFAKVCTM